MEDHGPDQKKRPNAFGRFVPGYPSSNEDAHLEHAQNKKLKPNSEAPLSTLNQQLATLPLPNLLLSTFKENPASSVKVQLFVSRSYSPTTSTSPPPVYVLKVTSASNSSGEVEPAGNKVDGGATPLLTETRLVAEGQFLLRSRV